MDRARMQPGGLVRELDGQGRIVLPKDWRDSQGITPGMRLELIPGQGGALLVRPVYDQMKVEVLVNEKSLV